MAYLPCILLVDDDDTTNFLNQALLRRMAVSDAVLVATDGHQALELLQTHCAQPTASACPVLILLDMKMPRMSGVEFLQAYARQPTRHPGAIIIMLTTTLNPKDLEQLHGQPVAGYLTKPLTRDKINQVLHAHFGQPAPARLAAG
ncbi:response regulator [Hymenobacter psychrotolerans]|uniref:Response regulator receiver domain-containing protein n=1 Tax=Hymenobacter psychrotolerans DSM 18569 TaxID=1121959 RepID=A0A1M6WQ62_9BACT|nr:response regulator [Hymenobacter psychrotolerans]SHK95838.1 Response regulator receiver domain-containing protein [Hymenobacter psychrotolerans DSM 18569]